MEVNYQHINVILIGEDIEGLIAAGAPSDEYLTEAQMIADGIANNTEGTVNTDLLFMTIARIWQEAFELTADELALREPAIRRVSEAILS